MDFSWSAQQQQLKADIRHFAQTELNSQVSEAGESGLFSRGDWQKCAQFGIQGLIIPPEYGGSGHDLQTAVLALEAFGYGCRDNGLSFALSTQVFSVQAILLTSASTQQKERYLSGMSSGKLIGTYAITEPDSGSDTFSMATQARQVEGGYLLNGRKHLITNAPVADFSIVFATIDPQMKHWGICAFIVDRDTPGYEVSPSVEMMGLRSVPIGDVFLNDCFVAEENLIGEIGSGVAVFNESQKWERAFILSSQLGVMERQLETAVAYAQSREQFGRTIGKFQAVSHRIADMKLRLECARLLVYRAAWLIDHDEPAMMEAALANLFLAESFVQSSMDAIRIHGGRGYLTEQGVEQDLRDAVGGTIYSGTSDILRNIVARELGL